MQLVQVPEHPLTPTLQKRLADLGEMEVTDELHAQAVDLCEGFLCDVDVKQVKVYKNRKQWETIGQYLKEIPQVAIVRVAEIASQVSCGVRWGKIFNGKAFQFFTWMATAYPVLSLLKDKCEQMRGDARASKALDTLDELAENAEQDGAKVKACELTLRAHHSAFGSKTLEKVGNTRPIIVVNIDKIFSGNDSSPGRGGEVVDAQKVP